MKLKIFKLWTEGKIYVCGILGNSSMCSNSKTTRDIERSMSSYDLTFSLSVIWFVSFIGALTFGNDREINAEVVAIKFVFRGACDTYTKNIKLNLNYSWNVCKLQSEIVDWFNYHVYIITEKRERSAKKLNFNFYSSNDSYWHSVTLLRSHS